MRRLLIAAVPGVLTYLVVVVSYDAVLAECDPAMYLASALIAFSLMGVGLRRLGGRTPS